MSETNPLDILLEGAVNKFHTGDVEGAQNAFLDILNADPKHPDALYFMAMIDHSAGRYEVAEYRAKDLLQVKPSDGKALNLMGTILMTQRNTADALEYFEKGMKHTKDDPVLRVNTAICYIGEGQPTKSIDLCKEAISLNPDYLNAYNILGNAYLGSGDIENAVKAFEKTLAIEPNFHDARFNLGAALFDLHRYDEAKECLDTYLDNNPASPHGLCKSADIYVIRDELDQAGPLYERALEADDKFVPAYIGRGKIFSRLKDFDNAMGNFTKAIELNPDNIEALMFAGDTLRRMDKLDAAEAAFNDVLTIDPENAQAKFHLAAIGAIDAPAKPDGDYVKRLFDEFAETFDQSLDKVQYDAPQQMIDLFTETTSADAQYDIIDLGCGTGLAGEKFSSIAKSMKGVDMSSKMLNAASKRGIYKELEDKEILDALVRHQKDFDLAIAADTFPYIGELESIFLAVNSSLRDDGYFLFSLEANDGDEDYTLGKTTRYKHSRKYLESLAERRGFSVVTCKDSSYRQESGVDVPGYIVLMQKT